MRRYASRPTTGSGAILNAGAANGASLSGSRIISLLFLGSVPVIAPISIGDGRNAVTASRRSWIPLFLKAAPQITGTTVPDMVHFLSAVRTSFSEIDL